MNSWLKKWIPILSLAVVPIAAAQSANALQAPDHATVQTVLSTPQAEPEEQKLQELQQEVDSIRSEIDARRADGRDREYLDQDSHPLWP
jgi:hypothetical protein